MSEPMRIQLSRRKGWRIPENTVKVDRSTPYGNPFSLSFVGEWFDLSAKTAREKSVEMFEQWHQGQFRSGWTSRANDGPPDLSPLRGKNLACWCALDKPCHADVLLEIANRPICEAA